jgi:hypothetical protein
MSETMAEKYRCPYTVLANHACNGAGRAVPVSCMTNRDAMARVGVTSTLVLSPTAHSRSRSDELTPSGRSSSTAAVTLPSAAVSGSRIISGTAVRTWSGGSARTSAKAPANAESSTSFARAPCRRPVVRTVRNGTCMVLYERAAAPALGSAARGRPSVAS